MTKYSKRNPTYYERAIHIYNTHIFEKNFTIKVNIY